MLEASAPTKFPIPFANAAGAGYIRPIPTASQIGISNGAASLTDGFPPLTFTQEGAGGVPPNGQDVNGILYQTTAGVQWLQAGGLARYDSTFATAIGGYPDGALLVNAAGTGFWLNTADNNTTNPDSGGAVNWVVLGYVTQSGAVTAGNVALFSSSGVIKDGGTLGSMAFQAASAVAITGGTLSGLSECAILTASSAAGFTVTCPNPVLELINGSGGNTWVIAQSSSTGDLDFSFNSSGVAYIDQSGVYHATSDARRKQDVADLEPALEKVSRLRPVTFAFKADAGKRRHIGVIAQDLRDLFPELVSERPERRYGKDAKGRRLVEETGETVLDVAYAGLGVVALRAIQELSVTVEELRREIADLRAKMESAGMKKLFLGALLALALLSQPAAAQSGCKYLTYGNVLTPAQWNYCFGLKQDLATVQPGVISYAFTASGTLIVPNGKYVAIVNAVSGGGGGGGGGGGSSEGGGGGGGAEALSNCPIPVTPGQTLTVTIGPGGSAAGLAAGGNGGVTAVAGTNITFPTLVGGFGGALANTNTGGAGGGALGTAGGAMGVAGTALGSTNTLGCVIGGSGGGGGGNGSTASGAGGASTIYSGGSVTGSVSEGGGGGASAFGPGGNAAAPNASGSSPVGGYGGGGSGGSGVGGLPGGVGAPGFLSITFP